MFFILIKIWNLNDGLLIHTINTSNNGISSWISKLILLSNNLLASASYDGTIKVYNLNKSFDLVATFDSTNGGHKKTIYALEPLSDGVFASGSKDQQVKLWNSSNLVR